MTCAPRVVSETKKLMAQTKAAILGIGDRGHKLETDTGFFFQLFFFFFFAAASYRPSTRALYACQQPVKAMSSPIVAVSYI